MTDDEIAAPYSVRLTSSAQRAIASKLPEGVAAAVLEFVFGALKENPYRVGKPLDEPFQDRHSARRGDFRIMYFIDDEAKAVMVVAIRHRRDAYRT